MIVDAFSFVPIILHVERPVMKISKIKHISKTKHCRWNVNRREEESYGQGDALLSFLYSFSYVQIRRTNTLTGKSNSVKLFFFNNF